MEKQTGPHINGERRSPDKGLCIFKSDQMMPVFITTCSVSCFGLAKLTKKTLRQNSLEKWTNPGVVIMRTQVKLAKSTVIFNLCVICQICWESVLSQH